MQQTLVYNVDYMHSRVQNRQQTLFYIVDYMHSGV